MAQSKATSMAGVLLQLGFRSYDEYLKSDLWKKIRDRVFSEKGKVCVCCGKTATQVHHKGYDAPTLSGYSIKALIPICGGCHSLAHRYGGKLGRVNKWIKNKSPRVDTTKPQKQPTKKIGLVEAIAQRVVSRYCGSLNEDGRRKEIESVVQMINGIARSQK